jgi:hypothetical protein
MRVCLFEDQHVEALAPLILDRPVCALTFGTEALATWQADYFGATDLGFCVRAPLVARVRELWPNHAVNDPRWLRAGPLVMVNARWIPPLQGAQSRSRCAAIADHGLAFASIESSDWTSGDGLEKQISWWLISLPRVAAGGRMLHGLWDLVQGHADVLKTSPASASDKDRKSA